MFHSSLQLVSVCANFGQFEVNDTPQWVEKAAVKVSTSQKM